MGRKKVAVYLMTALLLLVLILTELILTQRENFPFSVEITADGGSEKIDCWRRDGCFYVFLPSYADPDQAVLKTNWLFPVYIEGRRIGDGEVCGGFSQWEPLNLTYKKWGKTYEETVMFTQSANIPALYIDTASGSMDYVHKEKGNAEAGKLRLYTPEGTLDCSAQLRSIAGRGNSTWDSEKSPIAWN